MTRRYRSLRSEVAKRPPSRGTRGRSSGGMMGITSMIIHSGLLPDSRKASTIFSRLVIFFFLVWDRVVWDSSRRSARRVGRSSAWSMVRTVSAPIPTVRASSPKWSMTWKYWSSETTWCFLSGVSPGSSTMKESKYRTFSRSAMVMSSSVPILDGRVFRNQMCATGAASSMWPMRSRRTLEAMTSTPHFSQTMPRCFMRLYLPQLHS